MGVTVKEFKVKSNDGVHTLAGVVYLPKGEVKGVYHIVHGMTEHISRYDRIMTALAENGYVCAGYDNLGHGHTVNDKTELGYIAEKRGWELLARDVKSFADALRREYGSDLPYFLMGHSMGSFIVRIAAEKYVTPNKLIIMGTGGPNPAADPGLILIEFIKLFYGGKHVSPLLYKIAFGSYNNRFNENDGSSWLTTDTEIRKKYWKDELCSFKFSVSAMGDLIRLIKYSNSKAWFKNISSTMPILLVAGDQDPVGEYGKGVMLVHQKLQKYNKDSHVILYSGARHEILNDFCYEDVKNDLLKFIDGEKENTQETR